MIFDAHKNFAISTVEVAPSPASSGTSLTVKAGEGVLFPAAPFNAVIWPKNAQPKSTNAEIVRVTAVIGDVLTIVREQEDTAALVVTTNYQICAAITAKIIEDIEAAIAQLSANQNGLLIWNETEQKGQRVWLEGSADGPYWRYGPLEEGATDQNVSLVWNEQEQAYQQAWLEGSFNAPHWVYGPLES